MLPPDHHRERVEAPYHVHLHWGQHARAMSFYRLRDGSLQLQTEGSMPPLLAGPSYILADYRLATFLRSLPIPDVEYRPARLFRRRDGETWTNYTDVLPAHQLTAENFGSWPTDGHHLWHRNYSHLFVSPTLMDLLGSRFSALDFSPGFSQFAG
jgi:hypothetical protein